MYSVSGILSDYCKVTSGVPQGSVLGPTLFLFYNNDLDDSVFGPVWKFADDTKLMERLIRQMMETCLENAQLDLDSLGKWADDWWFAFNIDKFACLHFGSSNPCSQYSMNNEVIPNCASAKDLGVTVSSDLKFSLHCTQIVSKAERILWFIKRSFKCRSRFMIIPLYIALIRPKLEYASSAWCPFYQRDIDLIERVQHRVTKMISGLENMSYEERLTDLNLQSLQVRLLRADLILVHKMIHGLVDYDYHKLFEVKTGARLMTLRRNHQYQLRARHIPHCNYRCNTFAHRVVDAWNRLPNAVVTAPSTVLFKLLLYKHNCLPQA